MVIYDGLARHPVRGWQARLVVEAMVIKSLAVAVVRLAVTERSGRKDLVSSGRCSTDKAVD